MLAVWVVFGQTAGFKFVNYDDDENVFENAVVEKGLSVDGVGWAFTHAQVANWIPLTTLSHMLDCQLFGPHPGGHHLVNVLWHAANAVMLFLVLRQMTGSMWRSGFVAAVFAIHPLRAESVAWVSERKDVLSGFFFLLTIAAYVRYVRKPSTVIYLTTVILLALGLMAKSMVATLPFVLLLLDYWPLGRLRNARQFLGLVREKIPLFVLAAGDCLITARAPGLIVTAPIPMVERIANAVISYVVYLRQMIYPAGLAAPYPMVQNGPPHWHVFLAFILLTVISAMVLAGRKRSPCLLMGWLWFLGMLFPVIGIIPISQDTAHADRYTYLPGIGLAIAGTWAMADWSARWKYRRVNLGILMTGVVTALALCARVQTSYWRNSESVWTRALACTSGNYVACYNMGEILLVKGNQDDSTVEFRKALEIKPDYVAALNNLGGNLAAKGAYKEAIAKYRKALEIDPTYAIAHFNLGYALAAEGQTDEAMIQYRKALEIKPDYANAHFGLGTAFFAQGKWEESVIQLRKGLEIKPDFPEARHSLVKALLRKGDFDEAMACLEKTTPSHDPLAGWNSLGDGFLEKASFPEAIVCYQRALNMDSRCVDACARLGLAYFKSGQIKEAIDSWQRVLEIEPGQVDVRNNLAWLLATTPDASLRNGVKAIAEAKQANQLSGGAEPMILRTLAAAYAETGRYKDALATARHAMELAVAQTNDNLTATLQRETKLYEKSIPLRDVSKREDKR